MLFQNFDLGCEFSEYSKMLKMKQDFSDEEETDLTRKRILSKLALEPLLNLKIRFFK